MAYLKKRYDQLGGYIEGGITYAAATIHLTWAPIICHELNLPLDREETQGRLEEVYSMFTRAT
jgi:hypothetical protein